MGDAAEVLVQKVADIAARTEQIVKARIFGPEGAAAPNVAVLPEERYASFTAAGALIPPYDPETLTVIYEHSDALQPNIASYATNIESFGHRLEPSIDLTAPDANERIEEAIVLERLADGQQGGDIVVTPAEVQARRELISQAARIEKLQVGLFFRYCATDGGSFVELREKTRVDLEVTGNAYWEVIRNGLGQVAQLGYVPSLTCRLMRADKDYSKIRVPQKVSALEYRMAPVSRRFRRFVQIINGVETVFFKEFEDPRTLSAKTGNYYESVEALRKKEGEDAAAATEILHFKVHSPRSAYGVPRWIGALLAVLGSRASEEVNYLYFDNKAVPPLAVLVSGGVLAKEAVSRLQNYVNEHIKGRENFHSILLLEAEAAGGTGGGNNGRVRIEMKPMRDAQQEDALFQEYKSNNSESIGATFRVPRILRGSMTDFNRATAEAALEYAEKLVFQPERARLDHLINTRLFSAMGIRFWEFVSNSPIVRDPSALAEMVSKLVTASVLTPEEGRAIASDIFNRNFPAIDHFWVKQPPSVTQAGLKPADTKIVPELPIGAEGAAAGATTPGMPQLTAGTGAPPIQALIEALRAKLSAPAPAEKEQDEGLMQMLDALRAVLERANMLPSMTNDEEPSEENVVRIYVPSETMQSWLEPAPAAG